MICKCNLCEKYKRARRIIKSGAKEEMDDLITELLNENLDLSTDLDYYKAIFDGSWPNAKDIMLSHIAKIDEKAEDR